MTSRNKKATATTAAALGTAALLCAGCLRLSDTAPKGNLAVGHPETAVLTNTINRGALVWDEVVTNEFFIVTDKFGQIHKLLLNQSVGTNNVRRGTVLPSGRFQPPMPPK